MCSFCKQNYENPRGMTVIQKDATARYYCSGKCRKNAEMGRDNKKVNWVRKAQNVKDEIARKLEGKNERLEARKDFANLEKEKNSKPAKSFKKEELEAKREEKKEVKVEEKK